MKTKRLKHLYIRVACMLCMLSAASCVNDEYAGEKEGQTERVTVDLNFKVGGVATETDGTDPENRLKSIRVYVFDNNGADARLLGFFYSGEIVKDVAEYSFPIELGLKRSQTGQRCYFYIVANEKQAGDLYLSDKADSPFTLPEAAWNGEDGAWSWKGENITPVQIKELVFKTLPDFGSALPMAVEGVQTISSQNRHCTFILQRSVAKLNLYFAKYGAGQAFMGRGMYLYNIPEYGFLFPKAGDFTVGTTYKEDEETGDDSDSPNQNGGKVILPAGAKTVADETKPDKIDINEITKDVAKLQGGADNLDNYDLFPQHPVYLYAHPQGKDKGEDVLDDQNNTDGYQLKLLVHLHEVGEDGDLTDHTGEIYNVYLPKVQANQSMNVLSVFRMKSYIEIPELHWMILPWNQKGGDIVFE